MKAKQILLCSFVLCISISCNSYKQGSSSGNPITSEVQLGSVNNNVCKSLYGKVVLYAIFVDTKGTNPWSDYDITSTLDSIKKAMNWINKQALDNNKYVNIEIHYPENNHKIPIACDFPRKTLRETLFQPTFSAGLKSIQSWSDRIAVTAARTLPRDTSKIMTTRNSLSDKERLIARLRDIYKTDNVALMYFINNYYSEELSATFNIFSHTSIEYSIVSFKKPAIIAHEFLHLFGAWDLYVTLDEKDKKEKERKAFAMKEFPNEIMAFAYRGIDSLDISPFTKYCIGWEKQLNQKYTEMILGKNIYPVKY
jgi:hypothetical protein